MEEMVEATQSTQPDTTMYEWFYSEDGSACHIYERLYRFRGDHDPPEFVW